MIHLGLAVVVAFVLHISLAAPLPATSLVQRQALIPSKAFVSLGELNARGTTEASPSPDLEFGPASVGDDTLMKPRKHGTCVAEPPAKLRWNVDRETADKICCFNRHYAEHSGYWETTSFLTEHSESSGEITFYDTITGKALFVAPRGRSWAAFKEESKNHGWPSFRDEEVVKENVFVLAGGPNGGGGETVSVDGTHLGHNIPDGKNRYCINIASIAGVKGQAGKHV